MTQTSRTFRIFVSSTFSDLKAERNALQEKVFPRLRDLAMAHGCRFQAIDLRWGVSEEAALDQQTMKICLGEIQRCQKTSPRPNFIVLLGDRYGWRPLPCEIPADEFEAILPLAAKDDQIILNHWYLRDNNALPPVYVLQPRSDEFINFEVWNKVESKLRAILLDAVLILNLPPDSLQKYTSSATEQEIIAGALKVPDAKEHIFCFLREIQNMPKDGTASVFFEDNPQIANMQAELKKRLRETFSGNVHEYSSTWHDDSPSLDHLDQLCKDVYRELSEVISSELERLDEIDLLDREIANHEIFLTERSRVFIGRVNILNDIERYISSDECHPLVIWGVSGSGKSALMAKAVNSIQKMGLEPIYRFIGVTPESSNIHPLLESICRQISRYYDSDENAIPTDYKELVDKFPEFLALATEEKPLILFLDALDQLSDSENARNLIWLPSELPSYVRLVVSSLPGNCLNELEKKSQEQDRIEIQPMSIQDGKSILDHWLTEAHRKLQDNQEEYLLNKFQGCGLPLYLKLAFEEVRLWKSYDQIKELDVDVHGMIRDLFQRLSHNSNHGELMVSRSLSYLIASKNGLSEDELVDILSRDREVYKWFLDSVYQIPEDLINCVINHFKITGTESEKRKKAEIFFTEELKPKNDELDKFLSAVLGSDKGPKLPVVLWSKLFFDMEAYLIERDADESSLLSFFHTTSFRNVITEVFLTDGEKIKRHQMLADYFMNQPFYRDGEEKQKPNRRKLSELAFHQASAGLSEAYTKTLLDFSYLEAKLIAMGVQELIDDYDLVSMAGVSNESIRTLSLLQGALRLSAHILRKDPLQLPSQMTGRLKGFAEDTIQDLLEQIRQKVKYPWLRPLDSHLEAPGGALVRTLVGHSISENSAILTSDNQRIISVSFREIETWDLQTGTCITKFKGHDEQIWDIALTSDGLRAISASQDKTLKVWDLENADCLFTLKGHTDAVKSVVITPDNQKAISASLDKTIKVWDLESGECVATFTGHSLGVNDVKLTPNGQQAVSVGDASLKIWDIKTGSCKKSIIGHAGIASSVAVTHDGTRAISASNDKTLKVWDLESGSCIRTLSGHSKGVESVAITSDDRYAISGSMDMTIKIWNLESGACESTLIGHNHSIHHVVLTSDDHYVISTSSDRTIKIWDLQNKPSSCSHERHSQKIRAIEITQDGNYAVSASEDKTLKVWDVKNGSCFLTLEGHSDAVLSVALTQDNRFAISASADKTLRVWEIITGKCLYTLVGHTGEVWCVALSHDNRYIVSASGDKTLKIWDIKSGKCIRTLVGHNFALRCVTITNDDKWIISASGDGVLKAWDFKSGECLHTLTDHARDVRSVVVTPDCRLAISASWDKTLKVWDIKKGVCVRTLTGHSGFLRSVALIQGGRGIVSASTSKVLEIKIWDLETGVCNHTFFGHNVPIGSPEYGWTNVSISQDGKRAVSASDDRSLMVWDFETGSCFASFFGESRMKCAAFSPDGHTIVFGEWGGSVSFLQLENSNSVNVCAFSGRTPNLASRQQKAEPKSRRKVEPITIAQTDKEIIKSQEDLEKYSLQIRAHYKNQEYDRATKLAKEMEGFCRKIENLTYLQFAVGIQADVLRALGRDNGALLLYQQREQICRNLNNKEMLHTALAQQAEILYRMKEFEKALPLRNEQLQICRELGNKESIQLALGLTGDALKAIDSIDEALELFKEREKLCRELKNNSALQNTLAQQASIFFKKKEYKHALKLYQEQESICRELVHKDGVRNSLGNQALVLRMLGDIRGSEEMQRKKELVQ